MKSKIKTSIMLKIGLITISMLFITSISYGQCIQYKSEKGESCGNENSLDVKVTNNCSSTQYVMALCLGVNHEVKKVMGFDVPPGKTVGSYVCHGTNLTVRYWDVDPSDPFGASRAARAWYNKCRENNSIR